MGPFISTSFHRESKYKLQSLLFVGISQQISHQQQRFRTNCFFGCTCLCQQHLVLQVNRKCRGIKMQSYHSLHGVAILSPIKL